MTIRITLSWFALLVAIYRAKAIKKLIRNNIFFSFSFFGSLLFYLYLALWQGSLHVGSLTLWTFFKIVYQFFNVLDLGQKVSLNIGTYIAPNFFLLGRILRWRKWLNDFSILDRHVMKIVPIRFTEVSLDRNHLELWSWSLGIDGGLHSISDLNNLLFLFHLLLQHSQVSLHSFFRLI